MIVGNGMLANYLKSIDADDVTLFCSGVSNSQIINVEQFNREKNLLNAMPHDKLLVYTSSINAILQSTPYQIHKLQMEELVKLFPQHLILRVGNLIGKHNQKSWQFLPSMVSQIKSGVINIQNCKRDLLRTCDYVSIVEKLLKTSRTGTFRLCSTDVPFVGTIVDELEHQLGVTCMKKFINIIEPDVYHSDMITEQVSYRDVIKWYLND